VRAIDQDGEAIGRSRVTNAHLLFFLSDSSPSLPFRSTKRALSANPLVEALLRRTIANVLAFELYEDANLRDRLFGSDSKVGGSRNLVRLAWCAQIVSRKDRGCFQVARVDPVAGNSEGSRLPPFPCPPPPTPLQ